MPNQLGRDLWKKFCEGLGAFYNNRKPIREQILTKLFGPPDDYDDGYGWVAVDHNSPAKKSDSGSPAPSSPPEEKKPAA